jgi:hypothetical protein
MSSPHEDGRFRSIDDIAWATANRQEQILAEAEQELDKHLNHIHLNLLALITKSVRNGKTKATAYTMYDSRWAEDFTRIFEEEHEVDDILADDGRVKINGIAARLFPKLPSYMRTWRPEGSHRQPQLEFDGIGMKFLHDKYQSRGELTHMNKIEVDFSWGATVVVEKQRRLAAKKRALEEGEEPKAEKAARVKKES